MKPGRIAIVGGGITGLAAAWELEKQRGSGMDLEYRLFEASPRLGGVLRTERIEDCVVEAGPDSFLTMKPAARELCQELGLGDELIGSNDAQRKTYILKHGRLVEMPVGMQFMVPGRPVKALFSPLFSPATKLRFLEEMCMPPQPLPEDQDESVAAFVERHFGAEMVDMLAEPLLAGVYGGDAATMSARAVLPQLVAGELKSHSLVRGALAARKSSMGKGTGDAPQPLFTSLRAGMQALVDRLEAALPPPWLRKSSAVPELRPGNGGGWRINGEEFDSVILAAPAHAAAAVLGAETALGKQLSVIEYSSSMIVVLGYAADSAGPALPPGFGFLVPRSEGRRMLACTFVHNKFPFRVPPGRLLLRCFIGGMRNRDLLEREDAELAALARSELEAILGWRAIPAFVRVYRWPRAMAQYAVGHLGRIAEIEKLVARLPGVHLAGNAYRGIGIPDCVQSGRSAARAALAQRQTTPANG